jgi:pyruvate dehydrogenase E1 component alpha subunit
MTGISVKDLQDFEKEVIEKYKEGNTYGPVHLSGSEDGAQERALINIFKKVKPEDWVFTTHRSHYHALLKSKDKEWLMNEIIVKAQSSHINSAKYKIFSSSIVGGIIPIALGTALGIKRRKGKIK